MSGSNPNQSLDTSIVLSYLGKEGGAMLTLWRAQVEWLALTGINLPPSSQEPPDGDRKERRKNGDTSAPEDST
jgi:hypothetical protein